MNDWFSGFARLAKGAKARADAVNALFDQIVTGMDKMPTENQMNRGTRNYIDADIGVADAYVGSLSHVTGSYADGQEVDILIANTNLTTTPTLNISTIGAVVIKTSGANTVPIGALEAGSVARLKYNETLSHWELLGVYDITNTVSPFMATMLDDETADDALTTLGATDVTKELFSNAQKIFFTPSLEGLSTTGSPTFVVRACTAYVLGNVAFLSMYMALSSKGGMSGDISIIDMPWTDNGLIANTNFGDAFANIFAASGFLGSDQLTVRQVAGDKMSLFVNDQVAGDVSSRSLTDANLSDTSTIQFQSIVFLS